MGGESAISSVKPWHAHVVPRVAKALDGVSILCLMRLILCERIGDVLLLISRSKVS